eukprot:SAG11_NODE_1740_length_4338_cov_2.608634_4_plen_72_part_00
MVELVMPLFFFVGPIWCRLLAAATVVALQLGIATAGNYGTFNLLTALLGPALLIPPLRSTARSSLPLCSAQ